MEPCTTRFDAHCHLGGPLRPGSGPRQVICGTSEADWAAILARSATDPRALPMLGLHPWEVPQAEPGWARRLKGLLQGHRAGVGECGLDFSRPGVNRVAQQDALRLHLRLARELHRPIALHVVRAWGGLLALLREEGLPPAGAMIHAYSGSPESARTLQSMGVFLSFSGNLLRPGRPKLQAALRAVDLDHLLLETDGQADLDEVVAAAAALRGESPEDLAVRTWENGLRCFRELLA